MGISTSEIYMLLRARDEASRVLSGLGGSLRGLDSDVAATAATAQRRGMALTTIGAAIATGGVKGLQALDDMTQAAIEYNEAAALTQTQLDGVNISLEGLKDMGIQTARELPVAFEQIQPALYDIFSSIETDAPGAEKLLRGIGKAAVAGSVDMETAGRANIAILNAWKMPANDINKVNDVMFQLVRKGIGTYEEFGSTIGKAIPSAVRAGQTVEDLSGAMAFMTRNGLSASMASTSVARAMDALTKPKAQENLRELGIEVTDSAGKFRPFNDIMGEMRTELGKLDPAARAVKLQEIFKGSGGTIQAMRVFNLGIEDSQGLLQTLTDDMYNAGGAADEAYNIMSQTPEAQLQQLENMYESLRVELGDQLIPIKMQLVEALTKVMEWFGNLSPEVKEMIVKGAALAAIIAVVVGVILAVVGVVIMMSAAMAVAGIGIGAIIGIIAAVVGGLAALIAIIWVVVTYWDQIKAAAIATWDAIWNAIKPFIDWLVNFFVTAWQQVTDSAKQLWETYGQRIIDSTKSLWDAIMNFVNKVGGAFAKFADMAEPAMKAFEHIGIAVQLFWNDVVWPVLNSIIQFIGGVFAAAWEFLVTVIREAVNVITAIITPIVDVFRNVIGLIVSLFAGDWAGAWEYAKSLVVDFVMGLLGILGSLWNAVVNIFGSLFTGIWNIISGAVVTIIDVIAKFVMGIINFFVDLWDELVGHSIVPDMVVAIIDWFNNLVNTVISAIVGFVTGIINFFVNLAVTVITTISNFVVGVINWFINMHNKVVSTITNFVSGVVRGFSDMVNKAVTWVTNLVNKVVSGFKDFVSKAVSTAAELPGKVINAVNTLNGKIVTFITDVANKFLTGLKDMISKAVSTAQELPGKIVGAIGDLSGRLVNSGKSMITGFINGLKRGFDNAVGAVKDGLARVRDFFPFSPAKVGPFSGKGYTTYSGQALMKDFGVGITKGEKSAISAADAAMKRLNSKMYDNQIAAAEAAYNRAKKLAVRSNTKANRIARENAKQNLDAVKKRVAQALAVDKAKVAEAEKIDKRYADTVKAIQTAQSAVSTIISREWTNLATIAAKSNTTLYKVIDALNKVKTPKTTGLVSYVSKQRAALETLLKKHEVVTDKLKEANKSLASLLEDRAKYIDKVYNQSNDVSKALGKKSSQGIIDAMKAQVAATKLFNKNLAELGKLGLSKTVMDEIISAGVDAGGTMAKTILEGGAGAVKEINSLEKSLAAESKSLANTAGDQMYAAGIASAQGLVKGLQAEQAAIMKQVQKIAAEMAATLKKELKIKSPSRLTTEVGVFFGVGLAKGIHSSTRTVVSEAEDMAEAASNAISGHLFESTMNNIKVSRLASQIEESLTMDNDAASGVYNAGTQTVTLTLSPQTIMQMRNAVKGGVEDADGIGGTVTQEITLQVPVEVMSSVEELLEWIEKLGYKIHLMGA